MLVGLWLCCCDVMFVVAVVLLSGSWLCVEFSCVCVYCCVVVFAYLLFWCCCAFVVCAGACVVVC